MKEQILHHFQGNFLPFYSKFLPDLKPSHGDEHKCLCCFHEEKNPSLFINIKTGQYHCQGCKAGGDFFKFYADKNGLNGNFPAVLEGIGNDFEIAEPAKHNQTTRYVFRDAEGNPVHSTVRTPAKEFFQESYKNGRWVKGLRGVKPILYRLPQLDKANEVIVVEGEKDADNLSKIGLIATTDPMGAGKWKQEFGEHLKGKNVVLLPDKDDVGRKHMQQVAEALNGIAASVKLIELPNLPPAGDVSDFIAASDDAETAAERLSILIERAEPWESEKESTYNDVILDISDFRNIQVEPRKALIYPWLKKESIGMAYGWRGVGKTFLAMGLLDAMTNETDFGPWGFEVSGPGLFLDGEMTISDDHERFDDLGFIINDRKYPFYIYSDHYANRIGLPRAHLADESWRDQMKQILIDRQVCLFVIDNIASLAPGIDENKKQDWDPINQWLLQLRFAGISTLMLHHESKEGKQRGTAAREDNLDYSIRVKSPPDYVPEDGCRFIVHFAKARVKTSELHLIEDREFKLVTDDSGQSVWTHQTVRAQNKYEVLKLLDDGMSQADTAKTLGLTRGRVSQIRNNAIKDGLLNTKNKLTQDGFTVIEGGKNC